MDRMSSIELALKNEQTEMEYYRHEASRSRNPLARAMFETLARDEEEHMKRIRSLQGKLLSQGTWPQDVPIEVAGTDIGEVLHHLVHQAGSHQDHDHDDMAALEKAAEFEGKGAKFYADLSAACSHPMEKSFFKFLATIETEHLRTIQYSIGYLKDPEAWMAEHERSHLDGG